MTMNFYLGREINHYERLFKKIVKYLESNDLIGNKNKKKKRLRSETFRWLIDKFNKELLEEEK